MLAPLPKRDRYPSMNRLSVLLAGLLLAGNMFAAATRQEILLWPKGAPGSEGKTEKESVEKSASGDVRITRIHNPSITVYLPRKDKVTGASVIIIPGGSHRVLVITHEGYNVAVWLSQRGIASFVLKHRLARETNSTCQIEVQACRYSASSSPHPQPCERMEHRPCAPRGRGLLCRW